MGMSAAASSLVAGYAGPSARQGGAALPAWGTRRTPFIRVAAERSHAAAPLIALPTRAELDYQSGALARQAKAAAQLRLAPAAGSAAGAPGTAILTAKDLKQRQDMDLVLHMMGITGIEPMGFSIDWSQSAPVAPAAPAAPAATGTAGWGSAYGFPELFGAGAVGATGLPASAQGGSGADGANPILAQLQLPYGRLRG
jgi:hypothetical protein